MAEILFSNNASSLLAASIDDNDLVIQVDSGEGALFPNPSVGEYFVLALVNASGDLELCHCTSRSTDLLTVTRAQEGTAAQSWTNGITRVELRLTAGVMETMLQKTGDTMSGNLLMGGNEIQEARLTEDPVMVGGQLVGTALRGTEDDASNEVVVPDDGSRATAGGSPILVADDNVMTLMPIGALIMWYGSLGSLPSGWQNCDGTGGTPDLRDAFPRGAGGSLTLGASGGAATASGTTEGAGGHDHGGATDSAAADLAAHTHALRGANGPGSVVAIPNIGDPGVYGVSGAGYSAGGPSASYEEDATGDGEDLVESAGAGGGHAHDIQSESDHTHSLGSVPIIPPYKAVYFIMKVS